MRQQRPKTSSWFQLSLLLLLTCIYDMPGGALTVITGCYFLKQRC